MLRFLGSISLVLIFVALTNAQRPVQQDQTPRDTSGNGQTTGFLGLEIPNQNDSIELDFVYIYDLSKEYVFRDSTLEYFEDYDPTKEFDKFYLTLGNQASTHQSALYQVGNSVFPQLRRDQYEAYTIPLESLKFYNLNRPYNDISFVPMGSQDEFAVKAKFSQEFKEAVNVSVDYLRITHNGQYKSQAARTTNFGVGFWIRNPKKKHQMLVSYTSNNHTESYNGGHLSNTHPDSILVGGRINVPVNLADAKLRKEDFRVAIDNYIGDPAKWNLFHRIDYQSGYYLFSDDVSAGLGSNDRIFYDSLLIDDRGIRNYQSFKTLTNKVLIGRGEQHPVFIAAGITHKLQNFGFEILDRKESQLSVDGKVGLNFSNIFVKAEASLGLINIGGNLLLDASAGYRSKKLFDLSGGFKILRTDPYQQDQLLVLNHQIFYDQPLEKTSVTSIYGKLHIPVSRTSVNVESLLIDNAVYYSNSGTPLQNDEVVPGLKISAHQKLGWRWIQSDHIVHYQVFNNNLWNLPNLLSKHKLYVQFPLFSKALVIKVGAGFSQYLQDNALAFNPVTGVFYPIEQSLDWYRNLDFFLAGQVQSFRVFASFDNALDIMVPGINYHALNHAQWDAQFRFGIRWILFE